MRRREEETQLQSAIREGHDHVPKRELQVRLEQSADGTLLGIRSDAPCGVQQR
jgi:hypothetical protein